METYFHCSVAGVNKITERKYIFVSDFVCIIMFLLCKFFVPFLFNENVFPLDVF